MRRFAAPVGAGFVILLTCAGVAPAAHGPGPGHLPPTVRDVEVVGALAPEGPFGPPVEDQISDLSVLHGNAYVASVSPCDRTGFFVIDVSDPAAPVERTFVPAQPGNH